MMSRLSRRRGAEKIGFHQTVARPEQRVNATDATKPAHACDANATELAVKMGAAYRPEKEPLRS